MVRVTPENLLSGVATGKRGAVFKRYKKLEDDRSSWRSHWIELTDYLMPRRGRYLIESKNSQGRKRNSKIYDNTGGFALRTMSAGMMSGLTSPARPWFRLMVDDELMDGDGVKAWLGEAAEVIRRILSSSNFYNSMATVYSELGGFGTAPLLRRQHPSRLLHYRNFTAGEYVIAEDQFGDVDTLGREFGMSVAQMVERFVWDPQKETFDWSKVSKSVKSLWDKKNYDEMITVIHMIQPRRNSERDHSRLDGANRPWADIYLEEGADSDILLQEGGYFRKPFFVPRWDVLGGEDYGVSPGMDALGDIKQLQHEQKRKAQAIDKMVNPPMVASQNLKGRPTTVLPGGTTYVDPAQGGSGFQPAYTVQPRIAEMQQDIAEVQHRITRAFYADLFAMMINSDRRQITATEVVERHEEKLVLLGPVLQRLNTELLDPLIEDAFLIAFEGGLLPPPPPTIQSADIKIKYVSLLAQAQEAVAASGIERSLSLAGNLAAVFPTILDNVDEDQAFREYVEILGNGPEILRETNDVQAIRKERAAREAREQQLAEANMAAQTTQTGAQAAKLLSETDSTNPNALTALMRGTGQ